MRSRSHFHPFEFDLDEKHLASSVSKCVHEYKLEMTKRERKKEMVWCPCVSFNWIWKHRNAKAPNTTKNREKRFKRSSSRIWRFSFPYYSHPPSHFLHNTHTRARASIDAKLCGSSKDYTKLNDVNSKYMYNNGENFAFTVEIPQANFCCCRAFFSRSTYPT